MKVITCSVKNDCAYIIPIGDLHCGDKGFTKNSCNKLKEYIDFSNNNDNVKIFLNGDLLNCATRFSKTAPTDQTMDLTEQKDYLVKLLEPVKDKIIGAISGNHEQRLEDFCGDNPLREICYRLNIPYCGYTAVVYFKTGIKNKGKGRENSNAFQYSLLFHHTTGGGSTVGSKMNRIEKLRNLCTNCDAYFGSHNHMLGVATTISPEFNRHVKKISNRIQFLIDCGGYLEWDNTYAEKKGLEPLKLGSPIVKLNGKKKEIKVSL